MEPEQTTPLVTETSTEPTLTYTPNITIDENLSNFLDNVTNQLVHVSKPEDRLRLSIGAMMTMVSTFRPSSKESRVTMHKVFNLLNVLVNDVDLILYPEDDESLCEDVKHGESGVESEEGSEEESEERSVSEEVRSLSRSDQDNPSEGNPSEENPSEDEGGVSY